MKESRPEQGQVLIVDDHPDNLEILSDILSRRGYAVQGARNGSEALTIVSSQAPDLILLDVRMPHLDGFEVCQRLKSDAQTRDIPVIFISALGTVIDKVKGFKVGGVDYIAKPFQTEEVLARIQTHLALRDAQKSVEEKNARLQQEIAERVRVEEALRERENIYRTLVENLPQKVFLKDRDSVYVSCNTSYARDLGIEPHEITGKTDYDLYPVEAADRYVTDDKRIMDEGKTEEAEERSSQPGRAWIYIVKTPVRDEHGQVVGILGIFWDITERKRADMALQESEERFRSTFEQAAVGIVHATPEGRFLRVNQRLCDIVGYTQEEMLAFTFQDLVPPQDLGTDPVDVQQLLAGKIDSLTMERRYLHQSGSIAWVNLTLSLVREDSGAPKYFIGVVQDITGRKQVEAQRDATLEALRRERDFAESLIELAQAIVLVLDTEGRIVRFNPYLEEISGYRSEEMEGQDWFINFVPDRDVTEIREVFQQVVGDVQMRGNVNPIKTKDGRERQIEWYNRTLKDKNGAVLGVLAIGQDMTERLAAEDTLLRYAERLRVLREIDQSILAAQSSEDVAAAAVSHILQLIPCRRAGVVLFDFAANEALLLTVDAYTETRFGKSARYQLELLEDELESLRRGQIVVWGDPQSRDANIQTVYAEDGLGSTVSIPLVAQGRLIGSLNLGFEESEPRFTQEHQAIARQVADQLAIAIQQSRLNEQVQRYTKELQQQVSDRTRELAVLHEVAALASQPLDLKTKLARSLAQVLLTVRSAGGSIHLLDEAEEETLSEAAERKRLRLAVQQGLPGDFVAEIESLAPGEGIMGWVIEHDEPLFVPDIATDPRIVTALPEELRAYIGLPLQTEGRTVGVFSIIRGKDQTQLSVEEISLLTSIADQLAIAVESVRLRKRDERAAVLEERERLARDLHDSVTQLLYSMNLFAKSGRNAYNLGDMEELNDCLNELGEIGPQALREMRLLLYELRPHALEQRGLVGALQYRLDAVEGRVGVMTQLLASEDIELPGWLEEELYHIAIEALNNALKHAKASSVTVSLEAEAGRIWLEVSDNGIGFDPAALKGRGGLGIVGMHERAQRLGWKLQLFSMPGGGTKVRVELDGSRRVP